MPLKKPTPVRMPARRQNTPGKRPVPKRNGLRNGHGVRRSPLKATPGQAGLRAHGQHRRPVARRAVGNGLRNGQGARKSPLKVTPGLRAHGQRQRPAVRVMGNGARNARGARKSPGKHRRPAARVMGNGVRNARGARKSPGKVNTGLRAHGRHQKPTARAGMGNGARKAHGAKKLPLKPNAGQRAHGQHQKPTARAGMGNGARKAHGAKKLPLKPNAGQRAHGQHQKPTARRGIGNGVARNVMKSIGIHPRKNRAVPRHGQPKNYSGKLRNQIRKSLRPAARNMKNAAPGLDARKRPHQNKSNKRGDPGPKRPLPRGGASGLRHNINRHMKSFRHQVRPRKELRRHGKAKLPQNPLRQNRQRLMKPLRPNPRPGMGRVPLPVRQHQSARRNLALRNLMAGRKPVLQYPRQPAPRLPVPDYLAAPRRIPFPRRLMNSIRPQGRYPAPPRDIGRIPVGGVENRRPNRAPVISSMIAGVSRFLSPRAPAPPPQYYPDQDTEYDLPNIGGLAISEDGVPDGYSDIQDDYYTDDQAYDDQNYDPDDDGEYDSFNEDDDYGVEDDEAEEEWR
ncbi:hypothetical protein HYALB_00003677 [Hymenoscyphus albidus]|uniref:Uncharacterized protein n=1 Tax=Hymenoscyphus albidus TaxID=595503 RepID=A0A9N9LKA3_9HELO|nr:hypothetical protein HYALB_00003677 [Hymenoscyphus albidus]